MINVQYKPLQLQDGRAIDRITPSHYLQLRLGTELICHDGRSVRKGVDFILEAPEEDGFMNYGFPGKPHHNVVYTGPYRAE